MAAQSTEAERADPPRFLDRNQMLTLLGCVLFGVSIALPVMRWRASDVFPTSGSARVLGADDYTLVDGGYSGIGLVPLSALAVVVVGVAVLAARLGRWVWWVQVAALAVASYYPAWVLYVFLKKLDDPVFPAEGVVVLVLAFAAMGTGTYRSAPRPARASAMGQL